MLAHHKSDTGPGIAESQIGVNIEGKQLWVGACCLSGAFDTQPPSVRWAGKILPPGLYAAGVCYLAGTR